MKKIALLAALALSLLLAAAPPPAMAATLGQCQTTWAPRAVLHPKGWHNVTGQVRVRCSVHPRSFLLGIWLQHKVNGTWQYRHGRLYDTAPGTTYRAYRVQAACRTGMWRTVVHASTTDRAGYHQISIISGANYVANCP